MSITAHRERELFEQALELAAGERLAFLRQACGVDAELFRRISELLEAEVASGGFLGGPAREATTDLSASNPQQQIGRYRLLERLGEGGFGVVYLAEQTEPVRRRVALKILRPGLESRQVVARFQAERQLLALMDHANIARVFDAGATDDEKPFFVMELVPGLSLTRFCDEERLCVRERLELFGEVCDALQHAHQKGVIHRDLKPSNVLVTRQNGRAVPKVIDFGVAKATEPESGSPSGVTRAFELLGTPAYMSPEQARFLGRDVDIRTDIYSLGVMLHELLLGTTPLDAKELDAVELDVWRRRICEEEPPCPSLRWRSLPASKQTEIATGRNTTPTALAGQLAGDLDWIVMRCLEKDRERRYPSTAALAADIRRHLANEPVEAGAPGPFYRLGKFLRRHRLAVSAAAAVVLAMAAATVISLTLAWRATRAEHTAQELLEKEQRQRVELETLRRLADEEAATARAVTRFLNEDLLGLADPAREPERELSLRAVLDRASRQLAGSLTNEPAVAAAIHKTLGSAYQNLAVHEAAARHYEAARELFSRIQGPAAPETLHAGVEAAFARHRAGDSTNALPLVEAAAAIARQRLGRAHPMAIHCGHRLAWLYYNLQRIPDWEREAEETYQDLQGVEGVEDADLLGVMYLVARKRGTLRGGVFEAGEQILLHAAGLMQERRGPDHPLNIRVKIFLAVYYYDHWRNVKQAEALFLEVLEWQRRVLGERHEHTLTTLRNLGLLYTRGQQPRAAQRMYLQVLALLPGDSTALASLRALRTNAPLTFIPPAPATLQWRATRSEPEGRWTVPQFDDSEWPVASEMTPGLAWWRGMFELPSSPAEPLVIVVAGVKRGEVFLNGVAAGPEFTIGSASGYWIVSSTDATRALRAGRNVVAVRVMEASDTRPFSLTLHPFPPPESAGTVLR